MALASKNSSAIHSKTGGDKTKLQKHFQSGSLDDISTNPDDDRHLASLIYQIGEIQSDLDEIRRYDLPTRSAGLSSGLLYVDTKDGNKLKKA